MATPTQMVGGLVSGLDTINIIDQLMTIERQPVQKLETRILEHQTKLEAYRGVNSLLLEYQSHVTKVSSTDIWNVKSANSTNESILSASAGEYAKSGTYTFRVGRLAQTAQYTSVGFVDNNTSPVSPAVGGEIRIDRGNSTLKPDTLMQQLNGGLGVYHGSIRVTDRNGNTALVDLSTAQTLNEALNTINNTAGIQIQAAVSTNGDELVITDTSGGTGTLQIEDVGLGTTATDLGIAGVDGDADGVITGSSINYISGNTVLAALRDGLGINNGVGGTISIDDGAGNVFDVDLSTSTTMQAVMDTINKAAADAGSTVTADISASGKGLAISGGTDLSITNNMTDDPRNTTAQDLGIAVVNGGAAVTGHDLIADLNSVRISSLTGKNGTGISGSLADPTAGLGQMRVELEDGTLVGNLGINGYTGQDSVNDILARLNQRSSDQGMGLVFSINAAGNGFEVENTSGQNYRIFSNTGTPAEDLGFDGVLFEAGESTNTGDLDRQYLSRATRLDTLNNGEGVSAGSFEIKDTEGNRAEISTTGATTFDDIIKQINESGLKIQASINATGDGLQIVEAPESGTEQIEITELYGGSVAKDLGIDGVGVDDGSGISVVDGSFETVVTVDTDDTLIDVMNKLADADSNLQASIINDGSPYAPYRLVLDSRQSGAIGDFVLDTDLSIFNFQKTAKGLDSVLLYGDGSSGAAPIMLTSSTNTNNSAVLGVTIDMHNVSDQAVTVTVNEDSTQVNEEIRAMVDSYNNVHTLIRELDTFDAETGEPGILFSDTNVRNLMNTLSDQFFNLFTSGENDLQSFFDLGITFNDSGHLEMDTLALDNHLRDNFDGVRKLMTHLTDVARKDLNAAMGASDNAGGGTNADNLINGNTDSNDFGASNGYESANAIGAGGTGVLVQFDAPRKIDRLILNHIDSSAMPAKDYAIRDFVVEYLDPATKKWETLREVSGNQSSHTYMSFREPTSVEAVRVTASSTNAADGKFRMTEIEAFEAQGLASKVEETNAELLDSVSGFFAQQEDRISDQIDDIETSIDRMNEQLEIKEIQLIREYAAMESALATMQSQGDYFSQQMTAWNKGK